MDKIKKNKTFSAPTKEKVNVTCIMVHCKHYHVTHDFGALRLIQFWDDLVW